VRQQAAARPNPRTKPKAEKIISLLLLLLLLLPLLLLQHPALPSLTRIDTANIITFVVAAGAQSKHCGVLAFKQLWW